MLSSGFKSLTFLLASFPNKEYSGKFTKISSAKIQLKQLTIYLEFLNLLAGPHNALNNRVTNETSGRRKDSYEDNRKQILTTKFLLRGNYIQPLCKLKKRGKL